MFLQSPKVNNQLGFRCQSANKFGVLSQGVEVEDLQNNITSIKLEMNRV
jgi:hypothetical protein